MINTKKESTWQLLYKEDFLEFLAECLMYDEEPLSFDNAMPEQVFDSVGKLMTSAALEKSTGYGFP